MIAAENVPCPIVEKKPLPLSVNTEPAVAAELVAGNVTLRFFNGADQNLIRCAMQCLGGVSRVW